MALGHKTLDDLLTPITQQLGRTRVPDIVGIPTWQHKPQRVTDGMNQDQLVDLFTREAEKINVCVHRSSRDGLAACLANIVGAGEPDSGQACTVVCAADDCLLSACDVIREQNLVSNVAVWDAQQEEQSIDAALHATYGITYATAGIAETATVVQPTSSVCGRAISLLPLVHIAVVDASTIAPTMLEVMKIYDEDRKQSGASLPSQVCFISGPSATADIELVRVEGVHGPMYVHYVVVE